MTSPRGRWLLVTVAALAVLLFAGQWVADFLSGRWWAGALIPEAASFVAGVKLLRLTLDAAAVLIATAWFTGHLLVVHHAIGSIQISRQMANLEIREAVTPATLLPLAVAVGVALGLIAGIGAGGDWTVFALAWQGLTYGVTDPFLNRDLGVFVAQLPLWVLLHAFARLLAWSALAVVCVLYATLGAIRWQRGRPAISDHARRHLGLLLAAAALVLGWGFLLTPFEVAATATPDPAIWGTLELSTLALAGACLAAAAISVLWALKGHHLLMVAGWGVLLSGAMFAWMVSPVTGATVDDSAAGNRVAFDRLAYGLEGLDDRSARLPASPDIGVPSLWSRASIGQLVSADSQALESAVQTTLPLNGGAAPVWLVLRVPKAGPAAILAISDSRTDGSAGPLSYRAGDSLAYPGLVTFSSLPPAAVRPGAPRLVVDSGPEGVLLGGAARRLVLAWSLQSTSLLNASGGSMRARWHLAPRARLEHLAPFASWETPRLLMIGGVPVWSAYGYLESKYFPGSTRAGDLGSLEAGLLGAVDAVTGQTTIYLLPDAGPLTRGWAEISQGVVRPTHEIPDLLIQTSSYPLRLFEAQSSLLEEGPWRAGTRAGRPALPPGEPAPPTIVWEGSRGLTLTTGFEQGEDRRVRALLLGRVTESGRRLDLVRLSEAGSIPGPSGAQSIWDRFPSYEQVLDSIVRRGGRLERGPYRILPRGDAPLAYQPWYAFDADGVVTVPYVAIAQGMRAGAGRSFGAAWDNLRGAGAPLPPGFGPTTPLEEARRWMLRADSALHTGDWEGFGRAFGALRQALGVGPPPP
jgi:hypothetical protein